MTLRAMQLAEPAIRTGIDPVPLALGRAKEGRPKPFAVLNAEPPEALGADRAERFGVFFVDVYADSPNQAFQIAEGAEAADGAKLYDQNARRATYRSRGITGPLWSEIDGCYKCRVVYEARYRPASVLSRLSTA